MVKLIKGDIIEQKTEAIVNTVNCVGVMGRGIALTFKEVYPDNYSAYKKACDSGQVDTGKMFVHFTGDIFGTKYIINFPTKRHWKEKSHIDYIKTGMKDLLRVIRENDIKSISIPPLGCGLGGLDWKKVKPIIEENLKDLSDVEVRLIEPDASFEQKRSPVFTPEKNKLTTGRAALIVLIGRYLRAMMDPGVTLLEIHKLMYFLQEAGENLRLKHSKAPYGPYASNLRHVFDVMNNVYLKGYDDRVDDPQKPIELSGDSLSLAEEFIKDNKGLSENIAKVSSLISGFETPFGMELLSTVHWVIKYENAQTLQETVKQTHLWNKRKSMFTEKHIAAAWERLHVENG